MDHTVGPLLWHRGVRRPPAWAGTEEHERGAAALRPDPTDLDTFRRDAHRLVDWMADYLEGVAERPVWAQVSPGDIRAALPAEAPEHPELFDVVLGDLDDVVMPGVTHWQHPSWFAYFPSNTSPPAILAEMAAAVLGQQGMLWKTGPAVTEVESHVLDWMVDLLGLPATWRVDSGVGGGVIQATASDATHTALVAARHRALQAHGVSPANCVAYTSAQAHSSVEKGANVAGFGHVRLIDVDDDRAQRPDALRRAIEADLAAGLVPAFVCSAIGTTGTGAVDPVRAIGEVAREYGLWHHVDAAWAGPFMICEELRDHQDGLELVDSYVANAHKVMYTGMECSMFWVADRRPLVDALSILPPYLRNEASASGAVVDYRDWHVALGRRFRALKLWFVLRMFGAEGIRERLRAYVRLATELSDRIDAHPRLERIAPTQFPLVSFRHASGDGATRAMIAGIEAATDVAVTASELEDRPFLRISIGQLATTADHVDHLWSLIADHAAAAGLDPSRQPLA
jgi:aromatic-L-amino-acid/L-tryptophan decarboxylase